MCFSTFFRPQPYRLFTSTAHLAMTCPLWPRSAAGRRASDVERCGEGRQYCCCYSCPWPMPRSAIHWSTRKIPHANGKPWVKPNENRAAPSPSVTFLLLLLFGLCRGQGYRLTPPGLSGASQPSANQLLVASSVSAFAGPSAAVHRLARDGHVPPRQGQGLSKHDIHVSGLALPQPPTNQGMKIITTSEC